MQLHQLLFGTSKKRMKPIMIDTKAKCEAYKKAREATKGSKAGQGWHSVEPAPNGAVIWKQKTSTVKGSGDKTNSGPNRVGKGPSGYISKHGFQANT